MIGVSVVNTRIISFLFLTRYCYRRRALWSIGYNWNYITLTDIKTKFSFNHDLTIIDADSCPSEEKSEYQWRSGDREQFVSRPMRPAFQSYTLPTMGASMRLLNEQMNPEKHMEVEKRRFTRFQFHYSDDLSPSNTCVAPRRLECSECAKAAPHLLKVKRPAASDDLPLAPLTQVRYVSHYLALTVPTHSSWRHS